MTCCHKLVSDPAASCHLYSRARGNLALKPGVLSPLFSGVIQLEKMKPLVPLVLVSTFALVGCAVSEEETQAAFEDFVAERDHCEETYECSWKAFECPLGCGTAFNADYQEEIEEEAEELIRKYERSGRSCDYSCVDGTTVECVEGVCTLVTASKPRRIR